MKHLRRLFVALCAFSVGVALTPIRFEVEGWGYGRLIDDGGEFSATSYSSSYHVYLSVARFRYTSKEKANKSFDQQVRVAVRVIETTQELNEQGAVVVRRAVTISSNSETKQSVASVFWIDGSTLYSIDSPSLLHVLEFEKGILGEWRLGVRRIRYLLSSDHL